MRSRAVDDEHDEDDREDDKADGDEGHRDGARRPGGRLTAPGPEARKSASVARPESTRTGTVLSPNVHATP